MKLLRTITIVTVFIGVCMPYLFPLKANAQRIDLTLTPPKLEVLIKPDTQISIPYTVVNRGDDINVKPLIATIVKDSREMYLTIGDTEKLPIKVSFTDEDSNIVDTFTISKGSTRKIYLNLDIQEKTEEGDYRLSFIVETQPEFLDKQYSARVKSQIASPLLLTVTKTGKTQVRGEISTFEVGGKIFDSFDTIPIKLRVKNIGKNMMTAGGAVTISGSFGERATYQLQNSNILANSEKTMITKLKQNDSTLSLKGFLMGRYGVSVSVVLADGSVQLNKSKSFFVFPIKLILIASLGSFVGIMMLRKRR